MNARTPGRYGVRSLSPAAWFVCDAAKAQRENSRGQIGRMYATKAEADAALIRLDTPNRYNPFSTGGAL